jgi:hypothetical protein
MVFMATGYQSWSGFPAQERGGMMILYCPCGEAIVVRWLERVGEEAIVFYTLDLQEMAIKQCPHCQRDLSLEMLLSGQPTIPFLPSEEALPETFAC